MMSDNGILDPISSDYDDNESKIVLYIETLTGTAFEVVVSPMDSVSSVKNKIQHDEGIPVNQQHLLYGDKELKNSSYLEEEGITRDCTLKLVLGMRGGPISTRRASSRSEHFIWREIRDFVETTREDVMGKVPPGAKITLLVYREGDTINLIKVIENNDGTYSSLSDYRKPASSGRSRLSTRTDSESFNDKLLETETTISKMAELRHKMEELNLKKKHRNITTQTGKTEHKDNIELNLGTLRKVCASDRPSVNFVSVKSKTDKPFKIRKHSTLDSKLTSGSSKSKVKHWLNSDYYDDPMQVPQKKSSKKSHSKHSDNFYINKAYQLQHGVSDNAIGDVVFTESSDEENPSYGSNRTYKIKTHTSSSIKRVSVSRNYRNHITSSSSNNGLVENNDPNSSVTSGSSVDFNEAFISADDIAPEFSPVGHKTSKMLAKYYPDVSHSELRQAIAHQQPSRLEETNFSANKEIDLSNRNCTTTTVHETSSIAILEEEPETNMGNDEPDFNPPTGPISVPSPDENTFTISQIPRERISTSTGAGNSRNRIRVARFVLKDNQRPKTTPDKFSREFCEFLLNNNSSNDSSDESAASSTTICKCYELFASSNESQTATPSSKANGSKFSKHTNYISASNSKLDKINNSGSTNSNLKKSIALAHSSSSVCSWPCTTSTKGVSSTSSFYCDDSNNRFKLNKFENILNKRPSEIFNRKDKKSDEHRPKILSGIQNKGFFVEQSATDDEKFMKHLELLQSKAASYLNAKANLEAKLGSINLDAMKIGTGSNLETKAGTSNLELKVAVSDLDLSNKVVKSDDRLPPIEQISKKKTTRIRCKKCNKKLNISTIYTCRCGDNFCSQHRYSEVHGCKYDYKTEGRKLIEESNPLVLAPKLPKI